MVSKRSILGRLAEALSKTEALPKRSGTILYTDNDIARIHQEAYEERTKQRRPKQKIKVATGKWYEIGQLKQDDVSEAASNKLQYYFDKASTPVAEYGQGVNYWAMYFALLEEQGGEWTATDWAKWRVWYFGQNPERKATASQYQKDYRRKAERSRYEKMTPEQKAERLRKQREARRK
jgi:hypothetical protein